MNLLLFLLTEIGEKLSLYITSLANGVYTVVHKICFRIFCNLLFSIKINFTKRYHQKISIYYYILYYEFY